MLLSEACIFEDCFKSVVIIPRNLQKEEGRNTIYRAVFLLVQVSRPIKALNTSYFSIIVSAISRPGLRPARLPSEKKLKRYLEEAHDDLRVVFLRSEQTAGCRLTWSLGAAKLRRTRPSSPPTKKGMPDFQDS
jgi:hypothetical protein